MTEIAPRPITYCGVCSYPPEYCEFGLSFKKCKEWLEDNHQELFQKLYSDDALANATSTLSLEKEEQISKDLEKKQAREEKKQERELQKKLSSKVTIKRIERNRRKHIISISGLEVFNIDMKKLLKTFASKFATGASVIKNAEKKEEILVQGDVSDDAKEYIEKLLEEKGLNEVKVEQIDEKKKVKKAQPPPPQPQPSGST
ncbi:translation machinery-associated protein 22 [Hyphopichia burtonii NRRL Y-1933]|uniref:Translation machinery-associated protein 22 n=1 Tax=Hyphopichia burtonii NRRL Y-1933 TaxID=984485 RepID=A0A1E4RJ45_9ASCO|nr:translation machinery-associated protein 22 [Hyphopichia burtonii NRRL Y-1933]ODV67256.1 translation machinery-associated protein 22 [Hyphopichia burtonii NRRL Y-1933]